MAKEQEINPVSPETAALLAAFQEAIKTIVIEIRKPPVDPVKEAQKAREKITKEVNLKAMWENKLRKLKGCAHSRQDGTCAVGWARQSDGKERGYCPYCDQVLAPELIEFGEEYLAIYLTQRARPRGMQEAVRYVS